MVKLHGKKRLWSSQHYGFHPPSKSKMLGKLGKPMAFPYLPQGYLKTPIFMAYRAPKPTSSHGVRARLGWTKLTMEITAKAFPQSGLTQWASSAIRVHASSCCLVPNKSSKRHHICTLGAYIRCIR